MNPIIIRADASHSIGTGHIFRMLALAKELRKNGLEVLFATKELGGHVNERIGAPVCSLTRFS